MLRPSLDEDRRMIDKRYSSPFPFTRRGGAEPDESQSICSSGRAGWLISSARRLSILSGGRIQIAKLSAVEVNLWWDPDNLELRMSIGDQINQSQNNRDGDNDLQHWQY